MSTIWSNAVITTKGLSLLSKLIEGDTLTITRAVTGSGTVATSALPAQTAVTSQKQTLSFRNISYPAVGKCAVPVYLTNDNLATGYTATQVGVFATDPDDGEILFFIAQANSGEGTVVPSATEMPGYSAEWTFYFQYGQASSVSVTVDPSNTASQAQLAQYLPLAGGAMTGDISYQGTRSTKSMIRFIDDTDSTNGLGISIGGGGTTIIGGGESAGRFEDPGNGEPELMIISSDGTIDFYTNADSGIASAKLIQMLRDGTIAAAGFIGNASTATKLQTARTIKANLGSTDAASFDGTANVTPGVSGTLPVANGGTGNTSVDTTPTANSTKMVTSAGIKAAVDRLLALTGGTVTGTLILSKTTDLSGNSDNRPALIVGGQPSAAHIEMDSNEIQAKSNGTTPTNLFLNPDGGKVTANGGTVARFSGTAAQTTGMLLTTNGTDGTIRTGGNATTDGDIQMNNTAAYRAVGKYRTINNTSYCVVFGCGIIDNKGASCLEIQAGDGTMLGRLALGTDGLYFIDRNNNLQTIVKKAVYDATTE